LDAVEELGTAEATKFSALVFTCSTALGLFCVVEDASVVDVDDDVAAWVDDKGAW
jgi:hypothetical protein